MRRERTGFAVPVRVMLLVVGPPLLPEHRDQTAGALDLASAVPATTATLSIIYGIERLAAEGPGTMAAIAVACGLVPRAVLERTADAQARRHSPGSPWRRAAAWPLRRAAGSGFGRRLERAGLRTQAAT